jgi:hydrogenase-4 component B
LSLSAMAVLAGLCFAAAWWVPVGPMPGWVARIAGSRGMSVVNASENLVSIVGGLAVFSGALFALLVTVFLVRRAFYRNRPVRNMPTWACGYTGSAPRAQYTASSFVQPFTALFRPLVGSERNYDRPIGLFPARASFQEKFPDLFRTSLYRPAFQKLREWFASAKRIQHGRVQTYVLYIAVTLLVLLLLGLR